MAKRKIIKNYVGKKRNEQGSIFKYVGKTKTTYGFILDLPKGPDGARNKYEKGSFDTELDAVLAKRRLEESAGSTNKTFVIYTLSEFFDDVFLPYANIQNFSYITQEHYKVAVRRFVECFGDKKLMEIGKLDFLYYQKYLKTNYFLANATVNKYVQKIKRILDFAVEQEVIDKHSFKGDKLKTAKAVIDIYTNEDIKDILNEIKTFDDYPKYLIPVSIALYTGARAGEIFALKWEDIDFNKSSISINKALKIDKNNWIIGTTKTGNIREVGLPEALKDVLRKHQVKQKENQMRLGADYVKSDFVCTKYDGIIVTQSTIKTLRDNLKNRGIEFGMHKFRHTFASNAVKAGVHPKVLQEILGHTTIEPTMKYYVSVDIDQKNNAAEEVVNLMSI